MKLDEFNKLIGEDRYVVEDYKYPNISFTTVKHIIFDKKTNRRYMSVEIGDNDIRFIEVF